MNIQVSEPYPGNFYAVDDDTYDGPGSFIGSGPSPAAAINDLVEQIMDSLLTRIDRALLANREQTQATND